MEQTLQDQKCYAVNLGLLRSGITFYYILCICIKTPNTAIPFRANHSKGRFDVYQL